MSVVWDEKADALLLLSILATSPKVDITAISQMMGGEFNRLAVKNRIDRIKAKAKAVAGDIPTPPNTPAKQAAGKKRKDESTEEAGVEEKPATRKKARKRAVKVEKKEEDES
ncbi:uncharacterized protein GIQ15_03168 [Arthroderma uncinatum]|uniref:uncharacterized protein n=1 Tax=Arthroderma uncinatum TaxID=74035 RepID=UPI00144AE4B7|nr:uncharacterized protein GIQ15_03168 [Arthroderma uncinatum]KAF3483844.1 hypothetical protein GIQ15_03168 [Arthroderma uncinatum]